MFDVVEAIRRQRPEATPRIVLIAGTGQENEIREAARRSGADSWICRPFEADHLVKAGRIEDAIAIYERTIQREPENLDPYSGLAEAYVALGRWDDAIEIRRQGHEIAGDQAMTRMFAAAAGEDDYRKADNAWAQVQLMWLEARSTWAYVSPLDLARVYAQLDMAEEAFEQLDKAFDDRAPGLVFLNVDDSWDNIRDDPRFAAAVERVGLPA